MSRLTKDELIAKMKEVLSSGIFEEFYSDYIDNDTPPEDVDIEIQKVFPFLFEDYNNYTHYVCYGHSKESGEDETYALILDITTKRYFAYGGVSSNMIYIQLIQSSEEAYKDLDRRIRKVYHNKIKIISTTEMYNLLLKYVHDEVTQNNPFV